MLSWVEDTEPCSNASSISKPIALVSWSMGLTRAAGSKVDPAATEVGVGDSSSRFEFSLIDYVYAPCSDVTVAS